MIERPLEEKFRTRQDVKEHYSQEFLKLVLEDNMPFKQTLEGVIDGGYCFLIKIIGRFSIKYLLDEHLA